MKMFSHHRLCSSEVHNNGNGQLKIVLPENIKPFLWQNQGDYKVCHQLNYCRLQTSSYT